MELYQIKDSSKSSLLHIILNLKFTTEELQASMISIKDKSSNIEP